MFLVLTEKRLHGASLGRTRMSWNPSRLSSLTDILSGDSYVTISSVVPMIALLNNSILKNCDDDTELTATLKQAVKDDMNSRYNNGSEASQLLKIASFLNPRFKSKYVDDTDEVKQLLFSEVTVAVHICRAATSVRHIY